MEGFGCVIMVMVCLVFFEYLLWYLLSYVLVNFGVLVLGMRVYIELLKFVLNEVVLVVLSL